MHTADSKYWREIMSSTVSTLEQTPDVLNVTEDSRPAAAAAEIAAWEQRYHPMNLPPDVKSFLMSSNGIKLTWHLRHGDDLLPLGCMHINSLAELTPVPYEALLNESGELCTELPPPLPTGLQAFDLDVHCHHGRVCLISTGGRGEHARGQVWFQDLGCTWCFVANSFTDYFRLMLLHLGLPSWQYAFTENGLDPVAKQWFRQLVPDRLASADRLHTAVGTSTSAASTGASSQPGTAQERARAGAANAAVPSRGGKPVVRRKGSATRAAAGARPSGSASGARRPSTHVDE